MLHLGQLKGGKEESDDYRDTPHTLVMGSSRTYIYPSECQRRARRSTSLGLFSKQHDGSLRDPGGARGQSGPIKDYNTELQSRCEKRVKAAFTSTAEASHSWNLPNKFINKLVSTCVPAIPHVTPALGTSSCRSQGPNDRSKSEIRAPAAKADSTRPARCSFGSDE